MDAVLGRRKEIQVFGTDNGTEYGTCVRDYIHFDDLASAHIKAFQYLKENKQPMCLISEMVEGTLLDRL